MYPKLLIQRKGFVTDKQSFLWLRPNTSSLGLGVSSFFHPCLHLSHTVFAFRLSWELNFLPAKQELRG